eukprot:Awhi_evm1s15708
MSSVSLKTNIGGIVLEGPLVNASGCYCMSYDEISVLETSESGAFICKSSTPSQRNGNEPVRYYDNNQLSINSMGLPNMGMEQYLSFPAAHLSKTKAKKLRKPYFMSLAGLSLNDNLEMIQSFLHAHNTKPSESTNLVSALEFNFSCPNIIGKGQLGYDFDAVENYLQKIFETTIGDEIPARDLAIGIKLPPYYELTHFEIVSDILKNYPRLNFITSINSIANGLVIDAQRECPVIRPKNGFGGIGGSVVKPTALANVRRFYTLIGDKIDVIGCGGVSCGTDAFEHILCGASAVSVGTQLYKEDPKACFRRINQELSQLMQEK